MERYVRAIGAGADVEEVKVALAEAKAQVRRLEGELAELRGDGVAVDRDAIARRVADWRGILRRGPTVARQLLRKLFPGDPLRVLPCREGVAFSGTAACAGLLSGLAHVRLVVPPA